MLLQSYKHSQRPTFALIFLKTDHTAQISGYNSRRPQTYFPCTTSGHAQDKAKQRCGERKQGGFLTRSSHPSVGTASAEPQGFRRREQPTCGAGIPRFQRCPAAPAHKSSEASSCAEEAGTSDRKRSLKCLMPGLALDNYSDLSWDHSVLI